MIFNFVIHVKMGISTGESPTVGALLWTVVIFTVLTLHRSQHPFPA